MSVDNATTLKGEEASPLSLSKGKGVYEAATDVEFKHAIRNSLDIIADFYGANSSAVFWYNKDTKKFKLLAAASGSNDAYKERFDAGDDSISKLCRDKKSAIINLSKETGPENSGLSLYKNPLKIRSLIACPVIIDDEVIAVVLCDSKAEKFFGAPNLETFYVFSESLAYYIKYFIVSEELDTLKSETGKLRRHLDELEKQSSEIVNVFDSDTKLFNADFFSSRLTSEIKKNRIFNDHNLYCVYSGIDNINVLEETGFGFDEIEKIFVNEIKEQFNDYDMIFKISDNKYAIISNFTSDDKVFLEFEKIRKNISTKIYNLEGKEVSFTVSFAIKKFQDFSMTKERFLSDLDKMLSLSRAEGGNLVKIS